MADPEAQSQSVDPVFIFDLDDRPTPECHASTVVEAADGTLVAAWFGGTRERHDDVGIWVSRLLDGRWCTPCRAADGQWTLGRRFPCWNPVLFQPRRGPLMLFFKVGPSPSSWWGEWMVSEDSGRTWKSRQRLPKGGIGPVKNKPVQLHEGPIICPSSSEHDGWRVHFEVTPDMGRSWETIGPINDGKAWAAIQPSILLHPGNVLQVLCRTRDKGVLAQAWSHDGGRNWSPLCAAAVPNPNSGTDAVTLADGRHLLVYNPTVKGRNKLSLASSGDGIEWTEVRKLEDAPAGEFSYPAIIQSRDGAIHITYTFHRQTIKHVRLAVADLQSPTSPVT